MRSSILARGAVALALALGGILTLGTPAYAAPAFQLPFPCGQSWTGDSDDSSAHVSWEIDFNRGSTATADKGDTVVAAAAGTIEVAANQGDVNGYGNLIVINHGFGQLQLHQPLRALLASSSRPLRNRSPGGRARPPSRRPIRSPRRATRSPAPPPGTR